MNPYGDNRIRTAHYRLRKIFKYSLSVLLMTTASASWAGNTHPGPISKIILAFIIVFAFLSSIFKSSIKKSVQNVSRRKNAAAKKLLSKISTGNYIWDIKVINQRINDAWQAIQGARVKRNMETAKEYMSSSLYNKQKDEIDGMIARHELMVVPKEKLMILYIVAVNDYIDTTKNTFVVLAYGVRFSYIINDETQTPLKNQKRPDLFFKELWFFNRHKDTWVVNDIHSGVTSNELQALESFSEYLRLQN